MNELKQYKIVYTEAAEEDIFSKAEYIEKAYHDSDLAFKWYTRLRTQIRKSDEIRAQIFQEMPKADCAVLP